LEFELFGKLSALETHLVASFWAIRGLTICFVQGVQYIPCS